MSSAAEAQDWLVDTGQRVAHLLDHDIVTIGRDPRSAIVLLDATVSRRHAELVRGAAGWMLSVTGTTGATVNDVRVDSPVAMAPGDVAQFGTRTFQLVRGALPADVMLASPEEGSLQDPRLFRTTASMPAVDLEALRTTEETAAPKQRSAIKWAAALVVGALVLAVTCGRVF
jgi:pSer/pThr/pTyr-binding forkhead associated (FHA) protein